MLLKLIAKYQWYQIMLNSALQHLYHIYWWLCRKLSCKKSLLMIWKILGLFFNTLTADDKHSLLSRDNLTQPIQMQLSKKQRAFYHFFLNFWTLDQILNILKKKMPSYLMYFRKYGLWKTWLDKCLKRPVSEDPSKRNMGNAANHCWNRHSSTFLTFIDHFEANWLRKSLS